MEKYSLVLEGGGSKGAYQVGAFIALKENGYEFKTIVGTSIGAINGAMFAQNDLQKCINLWENMDLNKNMGFEETLDDENQDDSSKLEDALSFISGNLKNIKNLISSGGRMDPKPLKDLVNLAVDEEKLRKSDINFGLVTFNITDRKTEEVFIDDIPEGKLKNYVMASAYHPAFKLEPIDGKYYIDGGTTNRIPHSMVDKLEEKIIIVRTRPRDFRNLLFPKDAIVIEPLEKLASSMSFDSDKSKTLIKLGYLDAMKIIKGLKGKEYYFKPIGELQAEKILRNVYLSSMEDFMKEKNIKGKSVIRCLYEDRFSSIAKGLGLDRSFSLEDLLFALIERELSIFKLDKLRVRSLQESINEISEASKKVDSAYLKKLIESYEE